MNERILELAKQCGYWSGQTIEMNDVGINKFAELIATDVINRAEHYGLGCDAVEELKEHFGVEE